VTKNWIYRYPTLESGILLNCRFEITPQEIPYLGLAEFLPIQPPAVSSTAVSIPSRDRPLKVSVSGY